MNVLDDYTRTLLQLLPNGSAWPRYEDSKSSLLMRGLAEEFVRIDERAQQLINESLPSQIIDTLERWERDYGLPDSCATLNQTFDERKAALRAKYLTYGSQSIEFLTSFYDALGVPCNVIEYRERRFGDNFGGDYYGTDWAFVVQFDITPTPGVTEYAYVECTIRKLLHAHKIPVFTYSSVPDHTLTDSSITLSDGNSWIIDSGV